MSSKLYKAAPQGGWRGIRTFSNTCKLVTEQRAQRFAVSPMVMILRLCRLPLISLAMHSHIPTA